MKSAPVPGSGYETYGEAQADQVALKQLVEAYSHLVQVVAYRFLVDLPASIERDDLVSEGTIGLIEAIHRYDPSRKVKFETFATWRIRGAILDYLRKLDWSPRSLRRQAREIGKSQDKLRSELGRTPDDSEVARSLGISENEYKETLGKISALTVAGFSDLEPIVTDSIEDVRISPETDAAREHLVGGLARAIKELPEREKLVLELYYSRELSLKEIGAILELSESRICQIHGSAVIRLREILSDWRVTP